jgi:hypothetical protein
MNVEATLIAVSRLRYRNPLAIYSMLAVKILDNAAAHLEYGLRMYLTRGEGKD